MLEPHAVLWRVFRSFSAIQQSRQGSQIRMASASSQFVILLVERLTGDLEWKLVTQTKSTLPIFAIPTRFQYNLRSWRIQCLPRGARSSMEIA